jgi:DNA-binding NarL/FixJ family response regulator
VPPSEVAACCPDVILLDIYVRGAIDRTLPMREANPRSRIVAIGVTEVEPVVMACARAGISGFVPMEGSANEVVAAVHSAVRGELRCSPRTAGLLLNRLASLEAAEVDRGAAPGALTPREREILEQMGQGLSNKQIARHLAIRDATVKNHVHSILSKLGVSRRGEAVAQWRRDEAAVGVLSPA